MTAVDQAAEERERQRWLEWRRGGIGASDIAAARSGRYGGAYKVVADKLGLKVGAHQIDPDDAKRGHDWEQPIADAVHALTGLYVAGEQAQLTHPEQPRWRATADGLLLSTPGGSFNDVVAGLEIKTREPMRPWAWDYWLAQCQWSCLVAGVPRWLLAIATIDTQFDPGTGATIPELAVMTRWVWADAFEQSQLIELAEWLAELVDTGRLPEPTDADALPYVKAANATAGQVCPDCGGDGKHRGEGRRKKCERCDGGGVANIDNPPDIDDLGELLARHQQLKDAEKAAAEQVATVEAQIRTRMGEATEATSSDGRWRVRCGVPVRRFTSDAETDFIDLYGAEHPELLKTTLDRAAAKEAMPDEYDDLRRPSTDRRLTIRDMED